MSAATSGDDGARRRLGRVLVTGAAGFLGGALAKRLANDGEAVVISDLGQGAIVPTGLCACDLTEPEQVEALLRNQAIDTIIHAGAVSGPMVMADRPLDIWRINVTGTAHLLEAARRNRVSRFVLCSSIDVYGPNTAGTIDEETPHAPETVYGASKVAAEAALTGYAREHGIDGVAVRFSWIYGPGRRTPTTLERLIRAGLAGEAIALEDDARQRTHYIFIADAVAGVIAAAKAPAGLPRRAYNITAGHAVPLEQVVATLSAHLPALRATFRHHRSPLTGPTGFDLTNAAQDLGYRPQVPLSEGLRRYAEALGNE
ncbi:MAG TPA: NAD(P)-dependent oxidoreductase [Dongiaceae bacterium]|nr:NAD(P)-dependent oxidoreductase [Dongiaceae bacterium]